MKKETFEKAQELNTKIEDINTAIDRAERNAKGCDGYPLNFSFCFDEEMESLKQAVIHYLKGKRAKYQKQFDLLK